MSTTDYEIVKRELAHYIGTPEDRWDSKVSSDIATCIRQGIEAVVRNGVHQFSFMRPRWDWKTSDGTRRYTLPEDFEQFVEPLTFDGEYFGYPDIEQRSSPRLQQMLNQCETTGTPRHYALESPAHDGTSPQDLQLVLHPTPDAEYPLTALYQVGPVRDLDSDRPYFPGGRAYRDLFLAACAAMAESHFNDIQGEKHGRFQSMLAAAISVDHRKQPRNLGQLGGRGGRRIRRRDLVDGYTTYEGSYDL